MKFIRTSSRWYVFAFLCIFLTTLVAYGVVVARPVTTAPGLSQVIVVEPGMTAQQIGELLLAKGLIKNVLVFRIVAKIQGLESLLQAGEYEFTPNMTVPQIVSIMAKGETVFRQLVIPEGFTVDQVADLIEKENFGSSAKFKALAQNYAPFAYMETNSPVTYKAEGFIFPETYRITKGTTEAELLSIFVTQFDKQITSEARSRVSSLGLTMRQAIILASLVEKEARIEKDRPIIAGVFRNRLKQEMPLQSCATIQYILGYPKEELTVKDTEISSPYNTYQNMGLPPGPVANPGMAAINAVLYAAETNYLYFVADKNGAHVFSETYERHLEAIERVR